MTSPVCMMVLNQEPKPEGSQLNGSNDHGVPREICYFQCTCPRYNQCVTEFLPLQRYLSMFNRWYLPSHKYLLVQQEDKSRVMWLSKTTLANESMDRSWTAITLTVESARSPMLGRGFWLCIYWHLLWPKGEKLSLWKETRSHVCRSRLRWYRNLMQRTNGRPLTVYGC